MDRTEILRLLRQLAARLHERGIEGEMYVVGGAAIAIAFDERRATRDIDAVFEPKHIVYEIAGEMAEEMGLPPGWLNDAVTGGFRGGSSTGAANPSVKGFLAGPDPDAATVLDIPGLAVSSASPRMLLALKVLAHRVGEDEKDLRILASTLGLDSADAVLAVAEDVYGDRLDTAARFFVEELFG